MWNVQRSIWMVLGMSTRFFFRVISPIIFVSIVCIPMLLFLFHHVKLAKKKKMLNITPFTVIWCTTFYFILSPKWFGIVVATLSNWCNHCSVYANRKLLNVWMCDIRMFGFVWTCDENGMWLFRDTLAQWQKYSRYLMGVCPFFVVFISAISSPHEAVNCGALLCQANTKDAINRVILCSAFSATTEQQINNWKKLMSFSHQIVFSLALLYILQWIVDICAQ